MAVQFQEEHAGFVFDTLDFISQVPNNGINTTFQLLKTSTAERYQFREGINNKKNIKHFPIKEGGRSHLPNFFNVFSKWNALI